MSRPVLAPVTALTFLLLASPSWADATGINIIYPPQREAPAQAAAPQPKIINQTTTVTVISVTRPAYRRAWWRGGPYDWGDNGLMGGSVGYFGMLYPY
jgi:hypothetical protein